MARRQLQGLRAIITGASSGIGRALAVELREAGVKLLVTARREDRLAELCDTLDPGHTHARYLTGDITSAAFRTRLVAECKREFGGLDLLINNAGIGAVGPFAGAEEDRMRRIFDVNFFAAAELIRLALPDLLE